MSPVNPIQNIPRPLFEITFHVKSAKLNPDENL